MYCEQIAGFSAIWIPSFSLPSSKNNNNKSKKKKTLAKLSGSVHAVKHLVNFNPENQHFIWEQKEKSVYNFRTSTI